MLNVQTKESLSSVKAQHRIAVNYIIYVCITFISSIVQQVRKKNNGAEKW